MFSKKNRKSNERVLYETRPNMVIGCKKAIWGVIVLWIIIYISNPIKSAIINLQTYFISYIKFGIVGYVSLAIILIMLLDLVYIIWQLLSWYSTVYSITNERIITKKGILNTKTYYMPFKSIQDVDLSQNIIEKIVNVGTITAYSAYDSNNIKLSNISNPGDVEDILFEKIHEDMYHQEKPQYYPRETHKKSLEQHYNKKHNPRYQRYDDYDLDYDYEANQGYGDYNDDYEDGYKRKRSYRHYDYEEYPKFNEKPKNYEYEYYDDNLEDNITYAMESMENDYYTHSNEYEENEPYYNDYDYDSMEDFYNNNKEEFDIPPEKPVNKRKNQKRTSEEIFQRHFEKFR